MSKMSQQSLEEFRRNLKRMERERYLILTCLLLSILAFTGFLWFALGGF